MKWIFAIFSIIVLFGSVRNFGQEPRCHSSTKAGKYRWAGIDPLLSDPKSYFGFVVVRRKDVNRDFMIQLASRLKSEYCKADKLQVVIFDDRRHATPSSLRDYADSQGQIVLMRGFYSFDRKKGKDSLEFSTKFGGPTTDNKIDFTSEGIR